MITSINGKPADWTPEIWQLWHTLAEKADPKAFDFAKVERANYYTPRPYVDQYNRGSEYEGFTYVVVGTDGYKHVWQSQWKGGDPPRCQECGEQHWPFYGCIKPIPRAGGTDNAPR